MAESFDHNDNSSTSDSSVRKRNRVSRRNIAAVIFILAVVGSIYRWQGSTETNNSSIPSTETRITNFDNYKNEIDAAVELINAGESERALEILNTIVEEEPNHVLANFNIGVIAQFDGQLDEAILRYTKALSGAPTFRSALYNRGLAYRDLGNTDQAISDLSTVIAQYPESASAAFNLGKILVEQGDVAKGEALLARAKKLDPTLGD